LTRSVDTTPAAVFFDFDGVVCDSVDVKTAAFDELYRDHDKSVRAMVRTYHLEHGGISRYEKIRHFETVINGEPPTQMLIDKKADQFADLVVEAVIASAYIPGAERALASFHALCPLFVVSGTPQEELRVIVERRGLADFFTGVYGAPAKKADILSRIIHRHELIAEQTVMIGDAMTDYNAALEVAVPFIGVTAIGESPFPKGTREVRDLHGLADIFFAA